MIIIAPAWYCKRVSRVLENLEAAPTEPSILIERLVNAEYLYLTYDRLI